MTSSLVGSEMCIRDSWRKGVPISACHGTQGSKGNPKHADFLGGTTQRPVSYTHLTLPTICSV
eukprot:11360525-Prorocentrum_lima.AAC.1